MWHCSQNHTKTNTHTIICLTQTNMHVHAHIHKYVYGEPLKAIEQRVIIMRVNSRTPLSSSPGWCWELCPTGPTGNANPHAVRCHCLQPILYTFTASLKLRDNPVQTCVCKWWVCLSWKKKTLWWWPPIDTDTHCWTFRHADVCFQCLLLFIYMGLSQTKGIIEKYSNLGAWGGEPFMYSAVQKSQATPYFCIFYCIRIFL